ncbi:uncharacterized protein [Asterias amurensis]|uniref:uncharacterized protein n=1 Tax=Asterias amurensis TaxID=7602 RepID=UPI003AB13277
MGGRNSRESADRMVFTWPMPFSGLIFRETEEQDPVIDSCMHDITLHKGEGQTFFVNYRVFHGPATITLWHMAKEGTLNWQESGLMGNGTFQFRLNKADSSSIGTYTVEVLDQGRDETESTNPVRVSWDVDVVK